MPTAGTVLTLNGGSSGVKYAGFGPGPARLFGGTADHGTPETVMAGLDRAGHLAGIAAVGHRVVHGGPNHSAPRLVTPEVLSDLRAATPFAPVHLPAELALIAAVAARLPGVPQVVCFDTAFHRHLPAVSRRLPLPRRYFDAGVKRYGFHGLSYEYLVGELGRVAGPAAAGRVIVAHLGSGASLAAVRGGQCLDTTMGFTPAGGLVMATRAGDLDPGVLVYLARSEGLTADQLDRLVTRESGLVGVSGTSADMRDLLAARATDPAAADAVTLFCHTARKHVGALAAVLGGLDTLVFSGGVGEHAPEVRAEICAGLGFLGVTLDPAANAANAAVISAPGPATVRVIPTDEEVVIARTVFTLTEDARRA